MPTKSNIETSLKLKRRNNQTYFFFYLLLLDKRKSMYKHTYSTVIANASLISRVSPQRLNDAHVPLQ